MGNKLAKFKLERVHFMPSELKQGVLYFTEEFSTAAHLCACGCGSKIRTPIGPTEWLIEDSVEGPTVRPSIGNWQRPCKSHYLITRGQVVWSNEWSPEQIEAGRRHEEQRREAYFSSKKPKSNLFKRFIRWFTNRK